MGLPAKPVTAELLSIGLDVFVGLFPDQPNAVLLQYMPGTHRREKTWQATNALVGITYPSRRLWTLQSVALYELHYKVYSDLETGKIWKDTPAFTPLAQPFTKLKLTRLKQLGCL